MDTIKHYIDIDLAKKTNLINLISIKKNDSNSHEFIINLYNNSVAFNLTNLTAKLYCKKADSNIVFQNCTISDSNGKLSVILETQTISCLGEVSAEISIYGASGEVATSVIFVFTVVDTVRNDNAIQSISEFTALTTALALVTDFTNVKNEVLTARGGQASLDARLDGHDSQLADSTQQRPSLKSLSGILYTDKFKNVVLTKNRIFVPDEDITITETINIAKQMIIEGLGREGSIIKFTGTANLFNVQSGDNLTIRDLKLDATGSVSSVGVNIPNGGNLTIDNVKFLNFISKAISIKTSMNDYIANLCIYGNASNYTGVGIELSPANNDWNNVVTVLNCIMANCIIGIDLGASVLQTIQGCTFEGNSYGIKFRTTPPNASLNTIIDKCYFENAGIALYASGNGNIGNLVIQNCYFATQQIADLENINGLTFDNCFTSLNTSAYTPDVVLNNISKLSIKNCNNLHFKTSLGNPIYITGHNDYKSNIIKNNLLPESWGKSGITARNANIDNVYYDGKLIPSLKLASGTTQGILNTSLATGRSALGDIRPFANSRTMGAKMVAKCVGNTKPVSISVQYVFDTFGSPAPVYSKNVKAFSTYIGNEFAELRGNCISMDDIPAQTDFSVYVNIVKSEPTDNVTIYFDKLQGWFDYLDAPQYIETTSFMVLNKKNNAVITTDLTEIPGLYFSKGEIITATINADYKGYVCTSTGFNLNGVNVWVTATVYYLGQYVKNSSNVLFMCIQSGTSGSTQPSGVSLGNTTTDNTIVWIQVDTITAGTFEKLNNKVLLQTDSVASDVTTLKNDFNALLLKLKNAGLMKTT